MRLVRWLAAIGFCSLLGIASAQSKVGVINVQTAVVETAEIKKAQAELQAKYKPRQAEIEKIQKELSDLQAQLQGGKLPPQQEAEITARGQRRQKELQRMGEDLQNDVDRDRNDILQKTGQRMTEVVRKLAEERGLDVVIDSTNTLYYKSALDVTKEAIAAFDKAYPVK
jgi:outer membrane protein